LTELRFPANRIQVYGDVVVLYIDYSLTFEVDGSNSQLSGRGTEVFRKHNGHWLNTAWHLDHAQ
jgi:ketosteroid isomerase-like protein